MVIKGSKKCMRARAKEASRTRWFGGVISRSPRGFTGNKPRGQTLSVDTGTGLSSVQRLKTQILFQKTAKRTSTDGRCHFTLRDIFSLNITQCRSRVLSIPLVPIPSFSCLFLSPIKHLSSPFLRLECCHTLAFATMTKSTFQHELE